MAPIDLLHHGRSILRRLVAEAEAAQNRESYPDTGRVPTAEGGQWTTAVREHFAAHPSDYVRARYETAVRDYRERTDGSAIEQARDFTAAVVVVLEDDLQTPPLP